MTIEPFTAEERALLAPFVTDMDAPVFGLRNLPEVVKGALFSRYSRSEKSLRRMLLDEFIAQPESGFAAIVGGAASGTQQQIVATQQAEAFYDRVLIGYGDDSVAELGGAHIACEGISNIAAKALEDARLGISPLEKSTRYVLFSRKHDGRYRYVRERTIAASPHTAAYEAALDGLFDTYAALLDPTLAAVRANTPRDAATSERAYASATRAKAFDLLRGLLPMATMTNVGLFGNGRAFEYLLTRLYASPLAELRDLAEQLQIALDALIPSFVRRAKNERGAAMQRYLVESKAQTAALVATIVPPSRAESGGQPSVALIESDAHAERKVVAAILYAHSQRPLADLRTAADTLDAAQRAALLAAYVGDRTVRFHKPGRALEEAVYTFDICADIGAYRDLQRHRVLTQERQHFGVDLGRYTPPELVAAGLADRYHAALDGAAAACRAVAAGLPEQAQYLVPLAYHVRWRVTINLRELYHFCELRSAPQGHPTYRAVAQQMYALVRAAHPALAEGMRFVDMGARALERLDAERRLDRKLGDGAP